MNVIRFIMIGTWLHATILSCYAQKHTEMVLPMPQKLMQLNSYFSLFSHFHTTEGKRIMNDALECISEENPYKKLYFEGMKETLKLHLSYKKWMHSNVLVQVVQNCSHLVSYLVCGIKLRFQRNEGNGWNMVKIYRLEKMSIYCLALNLKLQQVYSMVGLKKIIQLNLWRNNMQLNSYYFTY